MQAAPDEQVEKVHDDGRDEDEHLPADPLVHEIEEDPHGQESLDGQADAGLDVRLAVDSMVLGRLLGAGVGHHLDDLGRDHLGIGVGHHDGHHGIDGFHADDGKVQQQEIEYQSDDPIGAYVRVFHDVENALTVAAPSAKAVDEVGQPVFMQGAGDEQACQDGQDGRYLVGEHVAAEVQDGRHGGACQPTYEWPVFDHRLVGFFLRLVQSPEGQTGEEDERRPDAVVPFGGVE